MEYYLYRTEIGYIPIIRETCLPLFYLYTELTFIPKKRLTSGMINYIIDNYVNGEGGYMIFHRGSYSSDDQFFNGLKRELVYSYVIK